MEIENGASGNAAFSQRSQHNPKKYLIVEFPDNLTDHGVKEMVIISSSWLCDETPGTKCYWPVYLMSDKARYNILIRHGNVDISRCQICTINILYETKDYHKAKAKLKKLEPQIGPSESDHEVRKHRRPTRFMDYALSDSSEDDVNPRPVSGQRQRKKAASKVCKVHSINADNILTTSTLSVSCDKCDINTILLKQLIKKVDILTAICLNQNPKSSELDSNNVDPLTIDVFPLKDYESLRAYNSSLDDTAVFKESFHFFNCIGGKEFGSAIRKILSLLLHHTLVLEMNWSGRNKKFSFAEMTNILKLIHATIKTHYEEVTIDEIDSHIKTWLRNSADREGGRAARKSKTGNPADISLVVPNTDMSDGANTILQIAAVDDIVTKIEVDEPEHFIIESDASYDGMWKRTRTEEPPLAETSSASPTQASKIPKHSNAQGATEEFQSFASHLVAQLGRIPLYDALQLQDEMQAVITKYRLRKLKEAIRTSN